MAAPATDALGLSALRLQLNAKLTSIGTAIANWTGDGNGLRDLKIIQGQISDTLNLSSTAIGTAYSGFGIGAVST
jgi:hypothetical protein